MTDPKPTRGRPKGDRTDTTVKISRKIAGMAKAVAVGRGISVAELLDQMLDAPMTKAYAGLIAMADQDAKKGGAK